MTQGESTHAEDPPDRRKVEQLRALYRAFNERAVDTVMEQFVPDVVWPNGWEGGVIHGRAAVRDYWLRQWQEIDPTVEPIGFTARADGAIAVTVEQTVRGLDGQLVARNTVVHTYRFVDGLVASMEIED